MQLHQVCGELCIAVASVSNPKIFGDVVSGIRRIRSDVLARIASSVDTDSQNGQESVEGSEEPASSKEHTNDNFDQASTSIAQSLAVNKGHGNPNNSNGSGSIPPTIPEEQQPFPEDTAATASREQTRYATGSSATVTAATVSSSVGMASPQAVTSIAAAATSQGQFASYGQSSKSTPSLVPTPQSLPSVPTSVTTSAAIIGTSPSSHSLQNIQPTVLPKKSKARTRKNQAIASTVQKQQQQQQKRQAAKSSLNTATIDATASA
ncbi:hypothetical protein EV182_007549, partial [Spiromyces aspiralis]